MAMKAIRSSLAINIQCAMQRLFTDRYRTRTDWQTFSMTGAARISSIHGLMAGDARSPDRSVDACASNAAPQRLRAHQ
jgi:hypothetical protein